MHVWSPLCSHTGAPRLPWTTPTIFNDKGQVPHTLQSPPGGSRRRSCLRTRPTQVMTCLGISSIWRSTQHNIEQVLRGFPGTAKPQTRALKATETCSLTILKA